MNRAKKIARLLGYYSSFLNYDLIRLRLRGQNGSIRSLEEHLDAAARWLCRAQDAFADGGVARSYSLVYNPYFRCRGWLPSYPETTGYIIPTMFDYSHLVNSGDIYHRAVRMADWECEIQMENGAVQGGTIDQKPTPAIFNTGQVIFGWLRAFRETSDKKYLSSAIKAGEFLLGAQDADGSWRKSLSDYASQRMPYYTYNTRTAWALCLLSSYTEDKRYRAAGIKNIEFALRQQAENGWFKFNCLYDASQPLLHTIAYSIRGVLEVGVLSNEQLYIESARKAADALMDKQRTDGSLSGRFAKNWDATVTWSCLTGDAQISIIWGRLFQITCDSKYLECFKKMNSFLKGVHLLDSKNPVICGAISGSHPIKGSYGRYELLSWAVKFFIDALSLEMSMEVNNI